MDGFEKEKERAKELAEAHWGYHEVMLKAIAPTAVSESMGDWYKAIAIHFYMHGVEDTARKSYRQNIEGAQLDIPFPQLNTKGGQNGTEHRSSIGNKS